MPSPAPDAPSPVWLDEGEVNPIWTAPGTPPSTRRPVRPAVVALAVVLALVLLLGLVWRQGGFERRTDVVHPVAVGELITTGPYELRFTSATVQQQTDYKDQVIWKLTVTGEGRTTGDETITPKTNGDSSMFVIKDPVSGLVATPEMWSYRPQQNSDGAGFTPGLPLQPVSVEFEYPAAYAPGPTITFVTFDLKFTDTSLLKNNDPVWNNADVQYRQNLPLQVLPPAIS